MMRLILIVCLALSTFATGCATDEIDSSGDAPEMSEAESAIITPPGYCVDSQGIYYWCGEQGGGGGGGGTGGGTGGGGGGGGGGGDPAASVCTLIEAIPCADGNGYIYKDWCCYSSSGVLTYCHDRIRGYCEGPQYPIP